jgi:Icc-related predicted phosphoesterase
LVLGDFHGKFPSKIKNILKKEKIDLIISTGDYPAFSIGKLFFKYVYGKKDVELWEFIGKEQYKKMVLKDHKSGESVVNKLNELPIPVLSVLGNHDYSRADDVLDVKKPKNFWKWSWDETTKISKDLDSKKNIHKIDYNYFIWKDLIFVGARGHSFPGLVKSKAYKKHRAILEKIFKKFDKENNQGKLIFVAHVPPYNTKLDLIKAKGAHKIVKNKHYGSKMFKRLILKYQPSLFLCGHIEESKGKQKIGRTLAINAGAIHHGDYFLVEVDETKGKIKKAISRKL